MPSVWLGLPRETAAASGLSAQTAAGPERERERERRVSDADASYYASPVSTRTLKHMIPK